MASRRRGLLAACLILACAGCASTADDPDPWEGFNRSMFAVNMGIDGKIQRPLASISQGTSTPFLRQRAINFFDNLSQPHTIANDLLQGRFKRAATDATRLVVNSTFGLAGLFDPAEETLGLRRIEQHFPSGRSWPGPAQAASLAPDEFGRLVSEIRMVEQALGSPEKSLQPSERDNIGLVRQSIVARGVIGAGEYFSADNLTSRRPADGLSPMRYWEIVGRKASRAYAAGEPIDAGELA